MDKPHNISGVFLLRIMVENYSGVDSLLFYVWRTFLPMRLKNWLRT